MPHIVYTERASHDLVRLYTFLVEKDESVALRAVEEIRDSFSPLAHMPKIGRLLDNSLREMIIEFGSSGYIALYDFDDVQDRVTILAVRHQLENTYPV